MKTGAEREAEIVQMLKDLFASRQADLRKHRVLLFGSRARGNAKQRSSGEFADPLQL
jgi:predicted nucleotidyltransferase